ELLSEAIQTGNASHQGRYIFAGFQTKTAPFALVPGPPDTVSYGGDTNSIVRRIDSGVTLAINVTGDTGFPEVFNSLIGLRDDLKIGDTANIRATRIDQLDAAVNSILTLSAEVGAKVNRLESTESHLRQTDVNLKSLLSRAEDIDIAEAILQLSTQETVYQAALAAAARTLQTSLMDFLAQR
ncbi:MAG: flagellin, partial [Chloroflexota bacterium]